jgi:hypothetical protein
MSIRDFLLGVAASYVAAILFSYVQPYVLPFLLSKLLRLIQLPILYVRRASSNRAFAYAAAGYIDQTPPVFLFISILVILYAVWAILPPITEAVTAGTTFEMLIKMILAILLLFLAYIFLYLISIMSTAIHLDKYYKWRLAIIAPYISLQEEKEVKAMWALMKNRFDYEQVNQKLNSFAEINGIVLPEPFLNVLKI